MADKFSLLAGIASDWWWETDAELRYTFLSDRFTQVFGLAPSVALGKRHADLNRTDYDNPGCRQHLDDIECRRAFRDFETTFVDAGGISRPVKISGTPLFAADGTFRGYIGVGHDLTELRQREREAVRQTANLDSIIQNIEQGVVLFDKDLRVVAYNRRLADWLQLDPDTDVRGQAFETLVRRLAERGEYDPEPREEAVRSRLALVRSNKAVVRERKRGDGRVISVAFNPLPEGGGVMTYSDVTEARAREAQLARSEENFRYRFRNLPLPQWVYHRETLRYLEVNDPALAKYGYARDEFLAMTIKDIRPPEEIPKLLQWLTPERLKIFHTTEWRHLTKDGRILEVDVYVRDIDYEGEPARIALIIDNTARNKALRQAQRIFETSQDVILVTDIAGKILRVNPSVGTVLGYREEDIVGRNARDLVIAEDLEAVGNEIRATRKGLSKRQLRVRNVHKDGRHVSIDWMAVWSEADGHLYFVGRDMTNLERAEEQLRQSQKMEAVGQLTGGVAHDFNNILMVILANVEALEHDQRLHPQLRTQIAGIDKAAQRAADLTSQLLAFSRKQALRPQPTNANDLVTATGDLLRRTLGEQIEIQCVLAGDLWNIEVDRSQLQSALVNVSLNARDAMPQGGRLLIETGNTALDEDYAAQHVDVMVGDYVMIAISDNGTGIPPEQLDRVFEPFFTTKGPDKGTGLGLSMVYGFIRQSNGHIKIYSEPGRGTSVRLYFPRADAPATQPVAAPPQPLPSGNERILVVEDDHQVRSTVVGQLHSLGYNVTEACDAASAVSILEAAPAPFDLVLTDVMMPGALNGKGLGDEVMRRWPGTRIVYMSGYTESAMIHHGRLDPDVTLLSKPFRKYDLARTVRQVLDG